MNQVHDLANLNPSYKNPHVFRLPSSQPSGARVVLRHLGLVECSRVLRHSDRSTLQIVWQFNTQHSGSRWLGAYAVWHSGSLHLTLKSLAVGTWVFGAWALECSGAWAFGDRVLEFSVLECLGLRCLSARSSMLECSSTRVLVLEQSTLNAWAYVLGCLGLRCLSAWVFSARVFRHPGLGNLSDQHSTLGPTILEFSVFDARALE